MRVLSERAPPLDLRLSKRRFIMHRSSTAISGKSLSCKSWAAIAASPRPRPDQRGPGRSKSVSGPPNHPQGSASCVPPGQCVLPGQTQSQRDGSKSAQPGIGNHHRPPARECPSGQQSGDQATQGSIPIVAFPKHPEPGSQDPTWQASCAVSDILTSLEVTGTRRAPASCSEADAPAGISSGRDRLVAARWGGSSCDGYCRHCDKSCLDRQRLNNSDPEPLPCTSNLQVFREWR